MSWYRPVRGRGAGASPDALACPEQSVGRASKDAGCLSALSRRSALLGLGALALGGCGFHPLYANHRESGFDADLASIKVSTIPNRNGQELAISLRDALNPTGARIATRYVLDVQLDSLRTDLGLRPDGTASRSQLTLTAKFRLREMPSDRVVLEGTTRTISGFDVLEDAYATVVAEQGASERSLQDLASEIQTRLAVFVRGHHTAPTQS
jgi:LPS-assembly lipoprotein